MAENSKGGILTKADKFLRRRKTKLLQSLGKTDITKDEILAEDCQRLERQQEVGNKFQRDLHHYLKSARALAAASKTFYTTASETYEPEWGNHEQVTEILTNMDNLWQDYLQKLQEQVQEPLQKYLDNIPPIKARVSKRGRKLMDYDNAKHNLEVLQNAKKRDEAKIAKAKDELFLTQGIYEELNNELHEELPEFYNSRYTMYGGLFENLFSAEFMFQTESGKVWDSAPSCDFKALGTKKVTDWASKLKDEHKEETYTPRKNIRSTIISSRRRRDRGDDSRYSLLLPFFNRFSINRGDDTNGHSENGGSQPGSPSASPTTADPGLTNGDTSYGEPVYDIPKDGPYEPTEFNDANIVDLSVDPSVKAEPEAKVEASAEASAAKSDQPPTTADSSPASDTTAVDQKAEVKKEAEPETKEAAVEAEPAVKEAEPAVKEAESKGKEEEPKVNGDLDTSTEPEEAENDAPPPPPASPPPDEKEMVDKKEEVAQPVSPGAGGDAVDAADEDGGDDLYQVPPPAKPVDDDFPKNYLYTVQATHAYKGEDDDELSFETHEVIYVMEFDDPEEQKKLIAKKKAETDPGWLMGMRKTDRRVGVFPENFTKKV